jgi:molecular chaperone GrpE
MAEPKNIEINGEKEPTNQDPVQSPAEADFVANEKTVEPESAKAEDPIKSIEEKLAAAQAEATENRDRMLRMAAELDNYKKRTTRELDDLKKYATENLLRQLLTVVDNLERAIASASSNSQNEQSVVDGVSLTLAEIMKILEKYNVSAIEALGKPFDPVYHQAMCQEERPDQQPNTVVQEFQKGYLIYDRLLRPAMVVVSKVGLDGKSKENSVDANT